MRCSFQGAEQCIGIAVVDSIFCREHGGGRVADNDGGPITPIGQAMRPPAPCTITGCREPIEREGKCAGHGAIAPPLAFVYRNHRGEVATRRAIPISVRYGSSPWHPDPDWLLEAFDVERGAVRTFAMKDMIGIVGAAP
jgi:hypothetical protein